MIAQLLAIRSDIYSKRLLEENGGGYGALRTEGCLVVSYLPEDS